MRSLRAVVALLCFAACGDSFTPRPGSAAVPRPAPGPAPQTDPWCTDSTEVALWAVGCAPRCIPATQPTIVCHGNNEVHGLSVPGVRWMATLEPAEVSGCGVPAYRVWSVQLDERPPWLMDRDTFSTWLSPTTHCTARPPEGFYETDFFQRHKSNAYLLRPENEVIPFE